MCCWQTQGGGFIHTHGCFKNERGLTVNDAFTGMGPFMDHSEEDEAFNHDASDVLIPGGFSKRILCPSAILRRRRLMGDLTPSTIPKKKSPRG